MKINGSCTKEDFLNDIKNHEVKIHKEDGLYKHIQCSKPGTNNYRFDILTWPGYLAITGDMGCHVFTRIEDMFEFFRNPKQDINPGYWLEKVVSQSIYKEFTYHYLWCCYAIVWTIGKYDDAKK